MPGMGEEIEGAMQHAPQPGRHSKMGERVRKGKGGRGAFLPCSPSPFLPCFCIVFTRPIIADSAGWRLQALNRRMAFRMTTITDNSWMNIPPAMCTSPASTPNNRAVTVTSAMTTFCRMFCSVAFER